MTRELLVAGGGIGGLAAALALARKGFRSVVLLTARRDAGPDGPGVVDYRILCRGLRR
mgnify:CR=1 FL=1